MNTKTKSFVNSIPTKKFVPISKFKVEPTSNNIDMAQPDNGNNMMFYIGIIVVLAILGINIFFYMGLYTELFADTVRPILQNIVSAFGYTLAEGSKITSDNVHSGAVAAIDIASSATKKGFEQAHNVIDSSIEFTKNAPNYDNIKKNNSTYKSPVHDEDGSDIQNNPVTNKKGFCLVGEQQGIRSCITVEKSDTCMSGEIFPSRNLCINPKLRV